MDSSVEDDTSAAPDQAIVLRDDSTDIIIDRNRPWIVLRSQRPADDLEQRLSVARAVERQVAIPRVEIVYAGRLPAPPPVVDAITRLRAVTAWRHVRFTIYTRREHELACLLDDALLRVAPASVVVVGPVPHLSEMDADTLLARGLRLVLSLGWPTEVNTVDLDGVRQASEMGIRLPGLFFITRHNHARALEVAESLLDANYHAGVGLLPCSAHPLFASVDRECLPAPSQFLEVLVQFYVKFQQYDDVFEPVCSLVDNIRFGAWDSAGSRPARVLIKEDGQVVRFYHAPGLAAETANRESTDIAASCSGCMWKAACGGCENISEVFDVVCSYRMMMLEALYRQAYSQHGDEAQ